MFRNVSSPFSFFSSTSVQKSGVPPVPAPLSVQTLCLRPVPVNRNLPGPPGRYALVQDTAACILYQWPLYPWCLWVFSGSGYRMYLSAPRETLHSKFNGQDAVSPAQPRRSVCSAHLAASSWSCPQPLPGSSPLPPMGLAHIKTLSIGKYRLVLGSRMAQSLPVVTVKAAPVWEPKTEKPLECSLKSFEED